MKPKLTKSNMVAAYLMLHLWSQFGSNQEGDLVHDFMGAPEDAGDWLEDLGLVRDVGYQFQITHAGRLLMEAHDHHYISPKLIRSVRAAVRISR